MTEKKSNIVKTEMFVGNEENYKKLLKVLDKHTKK